jgi:hypothetical protein
MHTVGKLLAASIAACFTAAALGQKSSAPDNRYRIALTVDGVPVRGSQELERLMMGKSKAEQEALQGEPMSTVQVGQTSQLIVTITDPNGVATPYTKGKRISYETFGCLSVSSNSVMTVTPNPPDCTLPEYRPLFVVFRDQAGKPITYSEFVFKVRP